MRTYEGFWSYVHGDDEAEGGRIMRLARDVRAQFQLLTGEDVNLFVDMDAIEWGEKWRDRVNQSLGSVAFFIAVLTPRYFGSPECRRELQFFARRAEKWGVKELVLPILYVDFQLFRAEPPKDELIAFTRTFQWEDWTDLRLSDVQSERYRRGVARLAERIVGANLRAEETAANHRLQAQHLPESESDEGPGVLDQLAQAELALPKWSETVEAIGEEIKQIGLLTEAATEDIRKAESHGKGYGARLLAVQRYTNRLSEPVERISMLGSEFVKLMHNVDEGFRVIISRAPDEIRDNPESRDQFCSFFSSVRMMTSATATGIVAIQRLMDSTVPIDNMSRDLRPVLRRLRQGLAVMLEAKEVSEEWVRLIDSSGIQC